VVYRSLRIHKTLSIITQDQNYFVTNTKIPLSCFDNCSEGTKAIVGINAWTIGQIKAAMPILHCYALSV
jgi:hypothetical protein